MVSASSSPPVNERRSARFAGQTAEWTLLYAAQSTSKVPRIIRPQMDADGFMQPIRFAKARSAVPAPRVSFVVTPQAVAPPSSLSLRFLCVADLLLLSVWLLDGKRLM